MCMVKKTLKPSLKVVYYAKLTEIFCISGSHHYHAYAWLKLFLLQKNFKKNLSQKDLQMIASTVVLAALSVPPYHHAWGASHLEYENGKECNMRMANLINFNLDPKPESREVLSRSALLQEVVTKGVISCVLSEVKDLYLSKLGGKLASASSVAEVQVSRCVPGLEKLATLRLLQQAAQVFQSMTIESLSQMISFFGFSVVEKISVDAVKHKFLTMKVDRMNGAVSFSVLGLESDGLRNHLTLFAESSNNMRAMIYPTLSKASKIGEALPGLAEVVEKEHKKLLTRKTIIEQRKEEKERHLFEKEREEEFKGLKQQKITEEAEQRRLATEYEQRKHHGILKEMEEHELEEAKALLQEKFGKNTKNSIIEGEKLTKQALMELARNEQLREKQEMEKKLQKLAKQMDYLERAKRQEAAPLIEAAYQRRLVEEKILHEREQQLEVEFSRQRHDGDLQEKNRLSCMLENKRIFEERIMTCRQVEFDRFRVEREPRIRQVLMARKQEREAKRKMTYFLRKEEERLNKLREEEEAQKLEEAETRKKDEAEHKAKLDEIAEKQRQRERELEERERLRRQQLLASGPPARPSEPFARAHPEASPAAAAAPAPGKYVPRHLREKAAAAGSPAARQAPPPEPDHWGRRDNRDRPTADKWRSDDR